MPLAGRKVVHSEAKGSPYFVGYNPAEFGGIKEVTTKNGESTVAMFFVKKIDGTFNMVDGVQRADTVYLTTQNGGIDEEIMASLFVALGLTVKKDGDPFTEADESLLKAKGQARTPVAILMSPQKMKTGKSAGKVFTAISPFGKVDDRMTIGHISLAGTKLDIETPSEKPKADEPAGDSDYM